MGHRIHVLPPREGIAGGSQRMRAELFRIEESTCVPVGGGDVRYFGSDQPRITFEAKIPWSALGVSGPPAEGIAFDLAVRWMRVRPPYCSIISARR